MNTRYEDMAEQDMKRFTEERDEYIMMLMDSPTDFAEAASEYLAQDDYGDVAMALRVLCRIYNASPVMAPMDPGERNEFHSLSERVVDWAIEKGYDVAPSKALSAAELEERATDPQYRMED